MVEFVDNLAPINALADKSSGFVWRLQTDEGNATSIQAFDNARIIVNLSVWASVDALKHFTYQTQHAAFLRRRRTWCEPFDGAFLVLWWIPAGHMPTVEEAKERLDHMAQHGETAYAFAFRQVYASPHTHENRAVK